MPVLPIAQRLQLLQLIIRTVVSYDYVQGFQNLTAKFTIIVKSTAPTIHLITFNTEILFELTILLFKSLNRLRHFVRCLHNLVPLIRCRRVLSCYLFCLHYKDNKTTWIYQILHIYLTYFSDIMVFRTFPLTDSYVKLVYSLI